MEKLDFTREFGKFIKHKRKERKLSQADLAYLLGNNYQNISRLERGDISPSLFWTNNLARILELSLWELLKEFDQFKDQKNKESDKFANEFE